jgi:hypothetical protein
LLTKGFTVADDGKFGVKHYSVEDDVMPRLGDFLESGDEARFYQHLAANVEFNNSETMRKFSGSVMNITECAINAFDAVAEEIATKEYDSNARS